MAEARDVIHQIEYRHHQTKDLTPVASSMSPDSLRGWDSRVRTWVRHPAADRVTSSACYQVFPNGQAALAFRYRDSQAADRGDGTHGRPLVSRVLVGQESLLSPEVAIALCRTGFQSVPAGPPPGQVTADGDLPPVSAPELAAQAGKLARALDEEAARQEGLVPVVAAALAQPSHPLAIHLRDTLLQRPLPDGLQGPLLWGLRRIAGPVLGPRGPEWSFSTFELPLGAVDPDVLPHIVFRQALGGGPPPARTRQEARVRPFAPDALDDAQPYAGTIELAQWLVAEYAERHGPGLEQVIRRSCGAERAVHGRIDKVRAELAGRHVARVRPEATRVTVSEPGAVMYRDVPEPEVEPRLAGAPGPAPETLAALGAHAVAEPEVVPQELQAFPEAQAFPGAGAVPEPGPEAEPWPGPVPGPDDEPGWAPEAEPWPEPAESPPAPARQDPWASLLAPSRQEPAPQLPLPDRGPRQAGPAAHALARVQDPPNGAPSVNDLLKQLETAGKDQFEYVMGAIYAVARQSGDHAERVRCRKTVSNDHWYSNVCKQLESEPYVDELAMIFGFVVIPDLAEPEVTDVVTGWATHAPPQVIGGLLAAAQAAGPPTWQLMMGVLQPVLAHRWTVEAHVDPYWSPSLAPRAAVPPARGRRGLRIRKR